MTQSAEFAAMLEVLAAAEKAAAPVPLMVVAAGGSPVDDALAAFAAGINEQTAAMSAELAGVVKRWEDRFFNGGTDTVPDDGRTPNACTVDQGRSAGVVVGGRRRGGRRTERRNAGAWRDVHCGARVAGRWRVGDVRRWDRYPDGRDECGKPPAKGRRCSPRRLRGWRSSRRRMRTMPLRFRRSASPPSSRPHSPAA